MDGKAAQTQFEKVSFQLPVPFRKAAIMSNVLVNETCEFLVGSTNETSHYFDKCNRYAFGLLCERISRIILDINNIIRYSRSHAFFATLPVNKLPHTQCCVCAVHFSAFCTKDDETFALLSAVHRQIYFHWILDKIDNGEEIASTGPVLSQYCNTFGALFQSVASNIPYPCTVSKPVPIVAPSPVEVDQSDVDVVHNSALVPIVPDPTYFPVPAPRHILPSVSNSTPNKTDSSIIAASQTSNIDYSNSDA
ncbi:hypothetical protein Pmani_023869 [Petrolisthes manimaculis]|uniref:Uncharacterized protein n=1 Tax=Petrolisthes manimaculis TaxID=1843537 RepID=A0AAE1U0P0_9EUCA|nr:hypothetical protein Pmani_023869 [Petrolisthes manimaculis]